MDRFTVGIGLCVLFGLSPTWAETLSLKQPPKYTKVAPPAVHPHSGILQLPRAPMHTGTLQLPRQTVSTRPAQLAQPQPSTGFLRLPPRIIVAPPVTPSPLPPTPAPTASLPGPSQQAPAGTLQQFLATNLPIKIHGYANLEEVRRYQAYRQHQYPQLLSECHQNPQVNLFCGHELRKENARPTMDVANARSLFQEAIWQIRNNRCDRADAPLSQIANLSADAFQARSRYWRYVCARRAGNTALAARMKDEMWQSYPLMYHTWLVMEGDPNRRLTDLAASDRPLPIRYLSQTHPEMNSVISGVEALLMFGDSKTAAAVVWEAGNDWQALEPEVRLYVAALMYRQERASALFRVLVPLFRDRRDLIVRSTLEMFFPRWQDTAITQGSGTIDRWLVMALIRQESGFDPQAVSSAYAYGLMQLLEDSGRSCLGPRDIGGGGIVSALLNPQTNVRAGVCDLAKRLQTFDGDLELTLIGYNAGIGGAHQYMARLQTPDRMLFLDSIPPEKETLDYAPLILRNYLWYITLYSGENTNAHLQRVRASNQYKIVSLQP